MSDELELEFRCAECNYGIVRIDHTVDTAVQA